jgi:hypothetical protein
MVHTHTLHSPVGTPTHLTESPDGRNQYHSPDPTGKPQHRLGIALTLIESPEYQSTRRPPSVLHSFANRTRPRAHDHDPRLRVHAARLHGPRRTTGPSPVTGDSTFSNRPPLISHHSLSPACRRCSVTRDRLRVVSGDP